MVSQWPIEFHFILFSKGAQNYENKCHYRSAILRAPFQSANLLSLAQMPAPLFFPEHNTTLASLAQNNCHLSNDNNTTPPLLPLIHSLSASLADTNDNKCFSPSQQRRSQIEE